MTVRKKEPSVLFILLSLAGFVLFWAMVSDAWGYSDHLSFKNGNYVYAYLVRIVWMLPAVWLILRFRDSLLLSGKELISRPVLNRLFLIMLGATLLLVFSGMLIAHHGLWVNPNINPLLELVKFAIVGIVEETVFRGWGYNALAKATTNKKAIVLSILFFALVHWPAYLPLRNIRFDRNATTKCSRGDLGCCLVLAFEKKQNPMEPDHHTCGF